MQRRSRSGQNGRCMQHSPTEQRLCCMWWQPWPDCTACGICHGSSCTTLHTVPVPANLGPMLHIEPASAICSVGPRLTGATAVRGSLSSWSGIHTMQCFSQAGYWIGYAGGGDLWAGSGLWTNLSPQTCYTLCGSD